MLLCKLPRVFNHFFIRQLHILILNLFNIRLSDLVINQYLWAKLFFCWYRKIGGWQRSIKTLRLRYRSIGRIVINFSQDKSLTLAQLNPL